MDRDDQPGFGQRRSRSKAPLAPMTEWYAPILPQYTAPVRDAPPRAMVMVGAGLALVVAIAVIVLFLSKPDVGDLVAATPVAVKPAPKKVQRNTDKFIVHPPVTLPSGMQIDRSSVLNYDLAKWLVTNPTDTRSFSFDQLRFEPGSATLDDNVQPMLQVLSQILTAYPQAKVTITGNGSGSLGIERATAIRDAMLKLAADPDQLSTAAGNGSETAPRITVKLEMGVGSDLDA